MDRNAIFIEHTILTVLLWIGLWGIISLVFDHYILSFGTKAFTYILFVIVSFHLLLVRNHV